MPPFRCGAELIRKHPFMFQEQPQTGAPHSTSEKPFIIELRQEDKTENNYFRPAARLKLSQSLRTSGLLLALSSEDVKNLLFLLTFCTPNGECRTLLPQLAEAMRVSPTKAMMWMRHLCAFRWQAQPLVHEHASESGLHFFTLSPHLVAYEHPAPDTPHSASHDIIVSSREAVIAHSREKYGRPRAEVEAEIEAMFTRGKPGVVQLPVPQSSVPILQNTVDNPAIQSPPAAQFSAEERALLHRLENAGLMTEQALVLMGKYDRIRIERQLQWLPYRGAKNPAGFLLAAVADNYEAPPALRHAPKSDLNPESNTTESNAAETQISATAKNPDA